MRRRKARAGQSLVCAALLALPLTSHAVEAIKVCLLAHNRPYSEQASGLGLDVDTARAVANSLGRTFEPVWISNAAKISEIDDNDFPVRKLAKGQCDAIFSVPGPARDSLRETSGLSLGAPYYGAAFELYGRTGETRRHLRELRDLPIANQAATVGAFALRLVGAKSRTFFAPVEGLKAVADGEAALALLWGPTAGAALQAGGISDVTPVGGYEPPAALSWNEHVATRESDTTLRTDIDSALAALAGDGTLARIAVTHGVPWRPPFAKTYSLGEMNGLR